MGYRINTRNQFGADGGSTKSIRTYLLTAVDCYASQEEQIKWMRDNFNHEHQYKKVIDKIEKSWKNIRN